MAERVNVDNFRRAETNRMMSGLVGEAGGVNAWHHNREPTPLDHQTVIRMNRDTLYSMCVADISAGARLTVPDGAGRYLSVMVVNQDHYINRVFHDPGVYELTVDEFDTPFVVVAPRILADPGDRDDVAAVNELQDRFVLSADSAQEFVMPDYDNESFEATRSALIELGRGLHDATDLFGRQDEVDPVHHLIGTAIGWGGLPSTEAIYQNVDTGLPVGQYELTVRDVPVDAFWSISVYNAEGFFVPNDRNVNSVNSITGTHDDDGSITIHFGGCDDNRPNCIPIAEGWNYAVRLYRPRTEIRDGSWTFPSITTV